MLDFFTMKERDFSPILSGSDGLTESFNSRLWDGDDEDQPEERFLRTKTTRVPTETLVSQIVSDRAHRIELKDRDKQASSLSSNKETPVYSHNIATMWTTLKDLIGSPLKQAPLGKAWALSCTVSASSDQSETLPVPLSPYLMQRPSDLSNILSGTDPDNEEAGERALKVHVGKLLRSSPN